MYHPKLDAARKASQNWCAAAGMLPNADLSPCIGEIAPGLILWNVTTEEFSGPGMLNAY